MSEKEILEIENNFTPEGWKSFLMKLYTQVEENQPFYFRGVKKLIAAHQIINAGVKITPELLNLPNTGKFEYEVELP